MVSINPHFQKLKSGYLFPRIEMKKKELKEINSSINLIDLGVGDITHPLLPVVYDAFSLGIDEMREKPIGYGPSMGYLFLREDIHRVDYKDLNIELDEIFVSNGAKCDCAHLLEIFSKNPFPSELQSWLEKRDILFSIG